MVVSTRALAIKFPTLHGTGYVRGEQYSARRCYEEALKIGLKGKKINMVSGGETQVSSNQGVSHDLDARKVDNDRVANPVDELEDVVINDIDAKRSLKLGKGLSPKVKSKLTDFLKKNLDVFTWNHEDMVRIDLNIMLHQPNINPDYKLVRQKRGL